MNRDNNEAIMRDVAAPEEAVIEAIEMPDLEIENENPEGQEDLPANALGNPGRQAIERLEREMTQLKRQIQRAIGRMAFMEGENTMAQRRQERNTGGNRPNPPKKHEKQVEKDTFKA